MAHLGNRQNLLKNLQLSVAETVSYYTDDDELNIELGISAEDETYSHIIYKASVININEHFNF